MKYGKLEESKVIWMPLYSPGSYTRNDTDARSAWREANGWLPVVEDPCACTASQIPCHGSYVERGGAIHHVCTAKEITDATVAEIRAAAKAGKINPSKLTATVKADMLVKLLEN